jgi:hypothetical protein
MYVGCSGAKCIYTCCLTVGHVYVEKYYFLAPGSKKGDFKFA